MRRLIFVAVMAIVVASLTSLVHAAKFYTSEWPSDSSGSYRPIWPIWAVAGGDTRLMRPIVPTGIGELR
jgi:hypothetical protein